MPSAVTAPAHAAQGKPKDREFTLTWGCGPATRWGGPPGINPECRFPQRLARPSQSGGASLRGLGAKAQLGPFDSRKAVARSAPGTRTPPRQLWKGSCGGVLLDRPARRWGDAGGQFQHKADDLVSQLTVADSITSGLALRWDVAWGNHSGAGQPAFTSNAYSRNGWLHRQRAMEPACGPAGIENGVPQCRCGHRFRTLAEQRRQTPVPPPAVVAMMPAAATFFRLSDRLCGRSGCRADSSYGCPGDGCEGPA